MSRHREKRARSSRCAGSSADEKTILLHGSRPAARHCLCPRRLADCSVAVEAGSVHTKTSVRAGPCVQWPERNSLGKAADLCAAVQAGCGPGQDGAVAAVGPWGAKADDAGCHSHHRHAPEEPRERCYPRGPQLPIRPVVSIALIVRRRAKAVRRRARRPHDDPSSLATSARPSVQQRRHDGHSILTLEGTMPRLLHLLAGGAVAASLFVTLLPETALSASKAKIKAFNPQPDPPGKGALKGSNASSAPTRRAAGSASTMWRRSPRARAPRASLRCRSIRSRSDRPLSAHWSLSPVIRAVFNDRFGPPHRLRLIVRRSARQVRRRARRRTTSRAGSDRSIRSARPSRRLPSTGVEISLLRTATKTWDALRLQETSSGLGRTHAREGYMILTMPLRLAAAGLLTSAVVASRVGRGR